MRKTQSSIIGDVKLSDLTKFIEIQCRYLEEVKIEKSFSQPSHNHKHRYSNLDVINSRMYYNLTNFLRFV